MKPSSRTVAVVAVALLVLTTVAVWDVAADRERMALEADRQHAVDAQVQSRQAPGDYDGDGFADGTDACPTRPETRNGFQDDDGCPDIVATTGAS